MIVTVHGQRSGRMSCVDDCELRSARDRSRCHHGWKHTVSVRKGYGEMILNDQLPPCTLANLRLNCFIPTVSRRLHGAHRVRFNGCGSILNLVEIHTVCNPDRWIDEGRTEVTQSETMSDASCDGNCLDGVDFQTHQVNKLVKYTLLSDFYILEKFSRKFSW